MGMPGTDSMGRVAQIWRYPVKSMHGEEVANARLTADGLEHDRLYAFESPAAPAGMLRLPAQDRRELLRFTAWQRDAGVEVVTPAGLRLAVDSPELLAELPAGVRLTYESTPQTDVRPLALIGLRTVESVSEGLGVALDARRFRANLLLDLPEPFLEDSFVGRTLRVGSTAMLRILERDPRCRFIAFDPIDPFGQPLIPLMKYLDRHHQTRAGVYAAVLTPGPIARGDEIVLV